MTIRACRVLGSNPAAPASVTTMAEDDLPAAGVTVRIEYSSLNYKDALAVTGRGRILRRAPLTAGIDFAGHVERSEDARFTPGMQVVAGGMGLGELHDGGLAEMARVPGDWLMPLPEGLTAFEAMALGTAGFTAALSLELMENCGQHPQQGPIVVTGATGGVGTVAVQMLSSRGYDVIAVSGRPKLSDYLRSMGAGAVVTPDALSLGHRPLERARFGGAIDTVGGVLLSRILSHVAEWGNVVAVGLAGGTALETTVHPFILRGVSLLGASSANCPMALREAIWQRMATDLKPPKLAEIVTATIALEQVPDTAAALLDRRLHGRVVVAAGSDVRR